MFSFLKRKAAKTLHMRQIAEFLGIKAEPVTSQTKHLTTCNQGSELYIRQGSAFNNQHTSPGKTYQQTIHKMVDASTRLHPMIVAEGQDKLLRDFTMQSLYKSFHQIIPIFLCII
ncbi:MAG: hypothetical protein ACRDHW_14275 [Ktedonobacteraceae bacterium]